MRFRTMTIPTTILAASLLLLLVACGGSSDVHDAESELETGGADAAVDATSYFDADDTLAGLLEPWHGDLDGMVERRMVRLLTVYNPMYYWLDGAHQRGIVYEAATEFESFLNKRLKRRRLKVNVVIVPVRRDQLLTALREGRGDIAAGNLTVTPERLALVEFSAPLMRGVSEIVVTGPGVGDLRSIDDLAGRTIRLRRESSYWSTVERLNSGLRVAGLPPMRLDEADAYLEDHDLLEMVNAGLLPLTIVDAHKARLWAQVFDAIEPREDLALSRGGEVAWAVRRGTPELRELLDDFVQAHREGTLFGNVVYRRYLENASWVRNALDDDGRGRLHELAPVLQRHAEEYGFDWLLIAAQGYQESGLDQRKRSRAGAVGVMQVRPVAAKQVGIADISEVDANVHAGVKYLRHIVDTYLDEPELDPVQRHLLALAAYNAGPSRLGRWRREAEKKGLDPDVWFDNVEVVVARRIGSEPVRYVSNIVKYYVAYKLVAEQIARRG